MSKEVLVTAVKQIIQVARAGDLEASYVGYKDLFMLPVFVENRPEDQRQALKLLILAKRGGTPSEGLLEAHRAAIPALTELVSIHSDPQDFEMLGICHLLIGNEAGAATMFREGLRLERDRNAASDLCGRLMTRVASI